jgi:hypothetical protein
MQTNGAYNWCTDTFSEIASTPIVTEGGIYAIDDSGIMYGITHEGNITWEYTTENAVKEDMIKLGSMIYTISKEGVVSALSTSSCTILFPTQGSDVSGVNLVDVEVDGYADTQISNVQIKVNDENWIDAEKIGDIYVGKMPSELIPLGNSQIKCRVVSKDGEELPPYTAINVTKKSVGKNMNVNVPTTIGYKLPIKIQINDENGNPLDHVNVIFGKLHYTNVNGSLEITPPEKGTYKLEIRRAGYKPFSTQVTVSDDYTIIIVIFVLVVLLISVFYIFYKKWMEE